MSLAELCTLQNKFKSILEEFNSCLDIISQKEIEDTLDVYGICQFSDVDEATIIAILDGLIDEGYIDKGIFSFCQQCSEQVHDNYCDICDKRLNANAQEEQERYYIKKCLPKNETIKFPEKLSQQLSELENKFLQGVPRFITGLTKSPPLYIKEFLAKGTTPTEGDFRDEMERSLKAGWWIANAEVKSKNGFSDLFIEDSIGSEVLIGEFKIWGRNDYLDVIDQLTKYFSEFDQFGFTFMINKNKTSIATNYKEKVIEQSSTLINGSVVNQPLAPDSGWSHFKSDHIINETQKLSIFHFIYDLNLG